jgi:magnesium-transporting ATPase (P-type)
MTWAGIVACQMGAAFAVRTSHASLRQVGVLSNRYLLRGVAFAIAFAAAIVYAPPLQSVFQTAALPAPDLLVLACFPFIVWGSDELWRWRRRHHAPSAADARSSPGSRRRATSVPNSSMASDATARAGRPGAGSQLES